MKTVTKAFRFLSVVLYQVYSYNILLTIVAA
jgi:hypothetical protein